ncbi:AlpA family transcriptional regulator [Actinomadura sp. NBRC 104412]|uniref:helix-turn-helix transcriptional regulator n=1 Tax=unclassified Actinomadura TaxID=2626254 RepID=UPI0025579A85|nr:helix-turn-helix domain-containing protein [Actinomadura sp. NBRC 104412]
MKKTVIRSNEKLTLAEVCAEIKISRSTFYEWRAKGIAPPCYKIGNGELRVSRDDLDRWWEERKVDA